MPQIEIVGFKESLAIALEGIAIDVQESLKDKLTKQHGKDTGAGQSSIMARSDGQVITINMAEHLKYLEYGTPPHFPPPEALEGWVMRKWGATSNQRKESEGLHTCKAYKQVWYKTISFH